MDKTIFKIDKRSGNFTIIDNRIFLDETLSWKAKGILSYLLSRPEDWDIQKKDLVNRSSDGETSVDTGLKELMSTDHVERVTKRNKDGTIDKWVYYVFEDPKDNNFSSEESSDFQKEENDDSSEPEPVSENKEVDIDPSDPDLENRAMDIKDSSPDCENQKLDTDDSEPIEEKLEVDNQKVENPVLENPVHTNTDYTKTEITNTDKNKERTSSLSKQIEKVKNYWFKIFKTEVGNNFDHQIKSLLKDYKLKELKAAIYNRSRASYYIEQKPEFREDPECFFTYPKTVGRDMNRNSWKNDQDKNKVYEIDNDSLRQFDQVRKQHEKGFRERDKHLNPPPDPKFVNELLEELLGG